MAVKVKDFTPEMLVEICNIVNRGNQCEIKRERENIVIVEIKRKALIKSQTQDN